MKIIVLIACLTGIALNTKAQVKTLNIDNPARPFKLDWTETFVIKAKLREIAVNGMEECLYQKEDCNLYRIDILSVLYYSNTSFIDSASLPSIKFILIPARYADSLRMNNEILLTARPSRSCNYLAFSKFYSSSLDGYYFYHDHMYISGLQYCASTPYRDKFEDYITSYSKLETK